ncbi:hypothetical protein [Sphingomonas sp. TREG-RG-20F-R18-01]|uniref:hypothetical protein n=1 Tax=Sphingomonas sp. TREG-RG-20F-R18-01 TaxID=2914982 RepID=UPI001F5A61ED|nr:hypothetical protein [Sphingomonas sp. TREG-RG-20F-R18-01]
MSIGSTLKHILGFVAGILIPGASQDTTTLTHSVQQHLADLYGAAAAKMAAELKLDTTGMSGPDKVFAITKALVATAQRDGFKGDLTVLGHVAVDIAQSAFRSIEPNIGADIVALASALTANPLVNVAAELVGGIAQKAADGIVFGAPKEVVQKIPAE